MNSMKNGSRATARVRARGGERPCSAVRIPAELVGDREDAISRFVRHSGAAVERVRDRALGHAGALGDVLDGDPAASVLDHLPASFDRTLYAVVCS
jgi:hypothetical protein